MILRQKGNWERRKNILGALGSVSVPRREKRNTLSFYPPLLMSPWRPTSQLPWALYIPQTSLPPMEWTCHFLVPHLYSEQTSNRVWDTYSIYWFRETNAPPSPPSPHNPPPALTVGFLRTWSYVHTQT